MSMTSPTEHGVESMESRVSPALLHLSPALGLKETALQGNDLDPQGVIQMT